MREKIKTFIQRLRLLNNDRDIEGNVLLWSFIKLFTGHQSLKQAAAALTYHTLFAIVPVTALMVAVTNLMGYGDAFREFIANILPGQEGIATEILTFADRYLTNRDVNYWIGAIVGLILLLYSLFSIFQTIDSSFNLLWNLKEHSLKKQLKVFLFVLLVPFVTTFLLAIWLSISSFFEGGFIREANIFVLTTIIYISLLFLAYKFIPNTKVNIRHAAASAVFCGVVFAIMQYCGSLIFNLFSNYKNVYGDLANFMLLILWIYFSWTICLAGSRWNYLLHEGNRLNIETRYKGMSNKLRKFLMVLLIGMVENELENKKKSTFTSFEVGRMMNKIYDIPPYVSDYLIEEMIHKGIAHIDGDDNCTIEAKYKGRTIRELLTTLETSGNNDISMYENIGIGAEGNARRIWTDINENRLQEKELDMLAKDIEKKLQ